METLRGLLARPGDLLLLAAAAVLLALFVRSRLAIRRTRLWRAAPKVIGDRAVLVGGSGPALATITGIEGALVRLDFGASVGWWPVADLFPPPGWRPARRRSS